MKLGIVVGITAGVSLTVGSLVGYFTATRLLEQKYQERLGKEIEETKQFYRKLHKKDEFVTPETAVKALAPEFAEAVAALTNYRGGQNPSFEVVEEEKEFAETVVRNVFANDGVTDEIPEAEKRNRTEEAPYILTKDEFMENDTEYTQSTVTYFAGDQVLIDSREDVIDDVDMTVGERNLSRFGYGSGDPNVLYVRNDRIGIEFEILLSRGKYSKEVAGLGD